MGVETSKDTISFKIPRESPSLTAILGLFAGCGSLIYSMILLPYRMDAAEKTGASNTAQIQELQEEGEHMKVLISRLDEDVLNLEGQIASFQEQLGYPNVPSRSRPVRPSDQ